MVMILPPSLFGSFSKNSSYGTSTIRLKKGGMFFAAICCCQYDHGLSILSQDKTTMPVLTSHHHRRLGKILLGPAFFKIGVDETILL
jgi:hypothetical protein